MANLWLALIPSLQDGNIVSSPAPGGPTREIDQMAALADAYVAELQSTYKDCGIIWRRCTGRPQSQASGLTTLYEIEYQARDWLNQSPSGTPALALNLHSDAGAPGSWVGYCYDSRGTHSKALGLAICQKLAPVFGTPTIRAYDYTDYVMATVMAPTNNVALLIEHGNHQNASDNLTLATKGREIARASLAAICEHYGIAVPVPPPPPPPPPESEPIPSDVLDYLAAHPSLGGVKEGASITYRDESGRWIVTTTTGAVVVRRSYDPPGDATVQIGHVDWLPEQPPVAPFDKGPTRAALDEAAAAIAKAKGLLG